MLAAYALCVATLVAGLVAGGALPHFAAAALAAAAATWFLSARARPRLAVTAMLDPSRPDADVLACACREAADLALQSRKPVALRLTAVSEQACARFRLELDRDGDLTVCGDGLRPQPVKRPGLWIADHPLPLRLPRTRSVSLRILPDGNRVSVSDAELGSVPRGFWAGATAVAVAACFADAGWLLAAALGLALQAYLLKHGPRREPEDA